jgi:hypothetical protein
VDQLDPERPGLYRGSGVEHLERRVANLVLLELRAHQAERERTAIDRPRHPDLTKHVGKRADVVLVSVGQHDRFDVPGALAEGAEVRQHEVDPKHLGRGKHQPRVDDHEPALVLEDRHVLADLPKSAEGKDPQRRRHRAERSRGRRI